MQHLTAEELERGIERLLGDEDDRESLDAATAGNADLLYHALRQGFTHVAVVRGNYRFYRTRLAMIRALGPNCSHTRGPITPRSIVWFL